MYRPANFSTSIENFPVLFYFHGRGALGSGSSTGLAKILNEGVPYFIKNNQFPTSFTVNGITKSFLVISPQFKAQPTPNDIKAVIDYFLARNYKIDAQRIYITGYSMGGDMAFKYPNSGMPAATRLAATVPCGAYNNPYVDSGAKYIAWANLPLLAVHSNDDAVARVATAQNFVNKINSYNPQVPARIWRFSGYAHDQAWKVMYDPQWRANGLNIYEWMLQYSLGSAPPPSNQPPSVNAGFDQVITLPTNSVQIDGTASDADGSIASYSWSKIAGPTQYTITNGNTADPTMGNLVAGTYIFRLTVTDNEGALSYDEVGITVNSPSNQLPLVNAGGDQSVIMPENSVRLTGTASDEDGSIASVLWSKVSGPAEGTIETASQYETDVTNLAVGTYVFSFRATDNNGGVATDQVQVTVYPTPSGATQYIRVNLYGGSNAYNNGQWNNWNVGTADRTNINSSSLKYSDGTPSTVTANLSHSKSVNDNYAGYGEGMAPSEVLRYTSYSGNDRNLTISGLSAGKTYNIALYSSRRSSSNSTVFTVNGISITINVNNNYNNAAVFSNLLPDGNGRIVIRINHTSSFNYLNGFTITENGSDAPSTLTARNNVEAHISEQQKDTKAMIYPNPVRDRFNLQIDNHLSGSFTVQVVDATGAVRKQYNGVKPTPDTFLTSYELGQMKQGTYFLRIQMKNWSTVTKMFVE